MELECLRELSPLEYLFSKSGPRKRIAEFENWLNERSESTIVVVGHSQYFKMMTGADSILDNCSVLKCSYHSNREGTNKWESHEILYSVTPSNHSPSPHDDGNHKKEEDIEEKTAEKEPSNNDEGANEQKNLQDK